MAKRIISGIIGAVAVAGSLLPLGYAFEIFNDFKNSDVYFWSNVFGELVMCSIAIPALWIGVRFLRFAVSGRDGQTTSLAKSVLLGIGFFFPGFVFSLPLTILLASDTKDAKRFVAAVGFSICIGVAAAIICTIALVRRRATKQTSPG
jgi:hypothetical protein